MSTKTMPEVTGNWTLTFELRAGSSMPQQKGVLLGDIRMIGKMPAETLSEHLTHTTPTNSPTNAPTLPPATTKAPEVESARIFGAKGTEVFMIILVLLFGIGLVTLAIKYLQIKAKLNEYRLHGATGYAGNPTYDNPMFSGEQRPAERYEPRPSIAYHIDYNNAKHDS